MFVVCRPCKKLGMIPIQWAVPYIFKMKHNLWPSIERNSFKVTLVLYVYARAQVVILTVWQRNDLFGSVPTWPGQNFKSTDSEAVPKVTTINPNVFSLSTLFVSLPTSERHGGMSLLMEWWQYMVMEIHCDGSSWGQAAWKVKHARFAMAVHAWFAGY